MKLHKSIVISIITIVLSSCSSVSKEQSSIPTPDVGADIQKGQYLEIIAPAGWNTFKTDDIVVLDIRNISENQITSGPNFSARVFIWTDTEWLEVKNKIRDEQQLYTLDPTENYDPMKTASIGVCPELPDYSVGYEIRIFLVGDLIENGKETRKVGSYIDITLSP